MRDENASMKREMRKLSGWMRVPATPSSTQSTPNSKRRSRKRRKRRNDDNNSAAQEEQLSQNLSNLHFEAEKSGEDIE